jgi:hypothetical protein
MLHVAPPEPKSRYDFAVSRYHRVSPGAINMCPRWGHKTIASMTHGIMFHDYMADFVMEHK